MYDQNILVINTNLILGISHIPTPQEQVGPPNKEQDKNKYEK